MRTLRKALTVTAIAGLLTTTGCATVFDALKGEDADDRYLETVHAAGVNGDDKTLIQLGHRVCARFERGDSLMQVGFKLILANREPLTEDSGRRAGVIMGAAIREYCPDQDHNLPLTTDEGQQL